MKRMDKNDMIGMIKDLLWRNGTTDENGVLTLDNDESEVDHAAEEIADEIINILSPIANRLDALVKEAEEQTADLPEEFDDLEDAETFNYYEGVRAAVERIKDVFPLEEFDVVE